MSYARSLLMRCSRNLTARAESIHTTVTAAAAEIDPRPDQERRKEAYWARRRDPELERLSRIGALTVPTVDSAKLPEMQWRDHRYPQRIGNMAKHHAIYVDVFAGKRWIPSKNLIVEYASERVHRGNIIEAGKTMLPPAVNYQVSVGENEQYTLAMLTPDGRGMKGDGIVHIHWLITNLNNGTADGGDVLIDYSPADPAKDTGYHRFVFCLFKQRGPVRAVSMTDRYQDIQELSRDLGLEPRGLAFFQAMWDNSESLQ